MSLIKICAEIANITEDSHLYRAIPQGFAESNIIVKSHLLGKNSYMARTGNGGTFTTPCYLSGLGYLRDWNNLMRPENIPFPFTKAVTLMRIKAKPYLDRLHKDDTGNEGIVITEPINLDDVEILFSADKNIVIDTLLKQTKEQKLKKLLETKINDLFEAIDEPEEASLAQKYEQNKSELTEQVLTYVQKRIGKNEIQPTYEEVSKSLTKVVSMFK